MKPCFLVLFRIMYAEKVLNVRTFNVNFMYHYFEFIHLLDVTGTLNGSNSSNKSSWTASRE